MEYYDDIPSSTKSAIDAYVSKGRPVGDFVHAVLTNNLINAMSHADDNNMTSLKKIVQYVYNQIPSSCWGSEEIVNSWIERGGKDSIIIPHNDFTCTHLMGTIHATYNQILNAFGFKPNINDDTSKVHCSWLGQTSSGKVAVWSWKEPSDPKESPDNKITWSLWYEKSEARDQLLRNIT